MKNRHEAIYKLAAILYPIQRSLTGEGVRQTLGILQEHLPNLNIKSALRDTDCFDWLLFFYLTNDYYTNLKGKH